MAAATLPQMRGRTARAGIAPAGHVDAGVRRGTVRVAADESPRTAARRATRDGGDVHG